MSLFGKKKVELPPLITEADFDEVANYDGALNFLVGLSDDEYNKVTQVAAIHRKAYQESAAVLGIANEPSTFINPPEPPAAPEPEFLVDDEPKAKGKKVEVKSGPSN